VTPGAGTSSREIRTGIQGAVEEVLLYVFGDPPNGPCSQGPAESERKLEKASTRESYRKGLKCGV